jgi:hypothetical protein
MPTSSTGMLGKMIVWASKERNAMIHDYMRKGGEFSEKGCINLFDCSKKGGEFSEKGCINLFDFSKKRCHTVRKEEDDSYSEGYI